MEEITRVAAPLRQQIVAALRHAIAAQEFPAGARLIERELCERFSASRTVVREALRDLEGEGLVTTIPNRGSVVSSLSAKEVQDLYEVRASLEALAGRLFTARATEEQLRALEEQLDLLAVTLRGSDMRASLEAKDVFYDILFEGAGNEIVRGQLKNLQTRVSLLRSITLSKPSRVEETLRELRLIVEAIRERDVDRVSELCTAHVVAASRVALRALAETSGEKTEG